MKDSTRQMLIEARLIAEAPYPLGWWYLSFADQRRPVGDQWLGGCYVEARGEGSAVLRSHELCINPGGEVLIFEVPEERLPPEDFRNRLLTREEVEAL